MLRYLSYGSDNLSTELSPTMTRLNWEFYANLRGALRATLTDGAPAKFEPIPTLWLFPPDYAHGWQSKPGLERIALHFSSVPDVIREACTATKFIKIPLEPTDVAMLREIGRSLLEHYRSPTQTSLLLFERALIDLSVLLLRDRDSAAALPLETMAVERVQRAIEWYLTHLQQRPTLDALADAVHISTPYLRRQFRLVYGKSPHVVLTDLRLEKAAQLLATTDSTLEVIARSTGFNSASDFCRVFKRRFDVYPKEWRTQVATKENPKQQLARRIARAGATRQSAVSREQLKQRGTSKKKSNPTG